MATKLQRKIKQLAKKRARKKNVSRRKIERSAKEAEKKRLLDEDRLDDAVDAEVQRLETGAADDNAYPEEVSTTAAKKTAAKLIGGIMVSTVARKQSKQVSRKQRLRKEKNIEKGTAVAEMLTKKWNTKKIRVKSRAQVRNEDLHTE